MAIVLNFVLQGVVANLITHARLFVNCFRGFGVVTSQNFAIFLGLAGRFYNIKALPCYNVISIKMYVGASGAYHSATPVHSEVTNVDDR